MAGEKGLADLIQAMTMLLEQGADVRLVLIGDGPERPIVKRLLRRLPAKRVEDFGYVGDRQSYMDLLRGGHVFVHPSRAEGVPKVLVEAMAAGLPIVASAAGAVREVLGDGQRGRLVPAGDTVALAAAIGDLLSDEWQRGFLRERGLDWAARHTAEAQADRLINWMRGQFPLLPWPP
jgi:glycosyltransferase involved in cell wall biosynthesis